MTDQKVLKKLPWKTVFETVVKSDPAFCLRPPFEKTNSEDRTGEGILNPYANGPALHPCFTKKTVLET